MLQKISVIEQIAELRTTEIVVIERKGRMWRVAQAGVCIRDNNIFMTLLNAPKAAFKKLSDHVVVIL
ncbi:MAG: hypothetical protein M0R51_13790 [Clostridia bacterium]|jgi:hypothetical protein|nr:hypothetical protein [Clostridia bacterium]